MHHRAYIRFIDAHTESIGGNNDSRLVRFPACLTFIFGFIFEPGMKIIRFDAVLIQQIGYFFRFFTVANVHH